eukprot:3138186-Karenia_brevis.AAC.1
MEKDALQQPKHFQESLVRVVAKAQSMKIANSDLASVLQSEPSALALLLPRTLKKIKCAKSILT